jgi:hypothetical protein
MTAEQLADAVPLSQSAVEAMKHNEAPSPGTIYEKALFALAQRCAHAAGSPGRASE